MELITSDHIIADVQNDRRKDFMINQNESDQNHLGIKPGSTAFVVVVAGLFLQNQ
jgi:hypothetical protein